MSSFTFSSKHWLYLFLSIVVTVVVAFAVTSEWMVRTYVTPHDNYEYIAERLLNSTQPNAAFGDSHVAAVPDYNTDNFINLGIGATTIRKMNDRVRFYYRNLKPGQVIIQADPHSFAEYRLEAQGTYVPETYSSIRLRILDPRHRGFMSQYWLRLLTTGRLSEQPASYDQLWERVGDMLINHSKTDDAPAPGSTPAAASTPAATSTPAVAPNSAAAPTPAPTPTATAASASTPVATSTPAASPASTPAPASTPVAAAASSGVSSANATAAPAPAATSATKLAPDPTPPAPGQKLDAESLAKFNALMEYEVNTHTPAANFRERDEARIYRDLIAYLVGRGATVCLVNYPVDRFYRERADRIPLFAETRKFYQEVAKANGIPYVSFWDRFNDPSMYQNTDHVNEKGSPILAREAREACFGKDRPK